MNQFEVRFSDLTRFAQNSINSMTVIHYGDLTCEAQDKFCAWFGADVDYCFPVIKKEDVCEGVDSE